MFVVGYGNPWPRPCCRVALNLWGGLPEMGLGAAHGPTARPLCLPTGRVVGVRGAAPAARTCGAEQGYRGTYPWSCLGQADAGPDLTPLAAGRGEKGARAAPPCRTRLSKKSLQSRASSRAQLAPLSLSRQAVLSSPMVNPPIAEPPLYCGARAGPRHRSGGAEMHPGTCLALKTSFIFPSVFTS